MAQYNQPTEILSIYNNSNYNQSGQSTIYSGASGIGPIGPQGPAGIKGDTGSIGPIGQTGPIGSNGSGFTPVLTTYAFVSSFITTASTNLAPPSFTYYNVSDATHPIPLIGPILLSKGLYQISFTMNVSIAENVPSAIAPLIMSIMYSLSGNSNSIDGTFIGSTNYNSANSIGISYIPQVMNQYTNGITLTTSKPYLNFSSYTIPYICIQDMNIISGPTLNILGYVNFKNLASYLMSGNISCLQIA